MSGPKRRSPVVQAGLLAFAVLGTVALIIAALFVAAAFLFTAPF